MPITAASLLINIGANTSQAEAGLSKVSNALQNFGKQAGGMSAMDVFKGFLGANVFMSAVSGLKSMAMGGIDAYASFERLGLSMQALSAREMVNTGQATNMGQAMGLAANRAKDLVSWTEQLAVKSPFDSAQIAASLRLGMSFGFTSKSAQELTQTLTDFATATGQGADIISRVTLTLGQMRQAGKIGGQELRELAMAGIDVNGALVKAFKKPLPEVKAMIAAGLIPANEALQAIIKSLQDDFGGAASRQGGTISGLITSFQELVAIGSREFLTPAIRSIQPELEKLVATLQDPSTLASIRRMGYEFGQNMTNMIAFAKDAALTFQNLDGTTKNVALALGGLVLVGPSVSSTFGDVLDITKNLLPAFEALGKGIVTAASNMGGAISTVKRAWDAGLMLNTALEAGLGTTGIAIAAVAVTVAAAAAVWYTYTQTVGKAKEEGEAMLKQGWADFFSKFEKSGADAQQTAQEFSKAIESMKKEFEGQPLVFRVVMEIIGSGENSLKAEALRQLSDETYKLSRNSAEYTKILTDQAIKQGYYIENGNLMIKVDNGMGASAGKLVIANYMLSESSFRSSKMTAIYSQATDLAASKTAYSAMMFRSATAATMENAKATAAAAEKMKEMKERAISQADAFSILKQAGAELGLSQKQVADKANALKDALKFQSDAQQQAREDQDLLSQAYYLGVIPLDQMTEALKRAEDGSLKLTDAQRASIQAARDQALAMKEAKQAVADMALGMLDMGMKFTQSFASIAEQKNNISKQIQEAYARISEIEKSDQGRKEKLAAIDQEKQKINDLTGEYKKLGNEMKKQMAQEVMGLLKTALDKDKISIEQYMAYAPALAESFGLLDKKGREAASGIYQIFNAITAGKLTPDQAAELIKKVYDATSRGKEIDLTSLINQYSGVGSAAGQSADKAMTAAQKQQQAADKVTAAYKAGDWVGLGQALGEGIASGIDASSSLIEAAAQEAAQNALNAARAALGLPAQAPAKKSTKKPGYGTNGTHYKSAGGGFTASYSVGGYADYGVAMLGENGREFILNAEATRQAENALGGSLSQSNVVASLSAAKNTKRAWSNRRKGMLPEADDGQAISGGSLQDQMTQAARVINTAKQGGAQTVNVYLGNELLKSFVLNSLSGELQA